MLPLESYFPGNLPFTFPDAFEMLLLDTRSSSDICWEEKELEHYDIEAESPAPSVRGLLSPCPNLNGRSSPPSLLTSLEDSFLFRVVLQYPARGSSDLKSTSWLDGVRGVAALAVYIFHAMGLWAGLVPAWHADPDQNHFLQLPFIRTIFVSGGAAVSLFFVISGYVLTYRSLRWIRDGSGQRIYPAVASSMFRRGFRLYIPPLILTFCEMLTTRVGYPPSLNFTFVPEPSILGQLWDWIKETNVMVNPIYNFSRAMRGFITHPKYDGVVWTIPLEFWGSFVCYILLLGMVRIPSNALRMSLVALLSGVCFVTGSWNTFCFLAGMLIADFNLGQEETHVLSSKPCSISRFKKAFWGTVFAIGFYLAGFPTLFVGEAHLKPMPGFETVLSITPMGWRMQDHARIWWSVSGVSLLISVSQLPRLKSVFESNVCQYLGKISFSLYLVHSFSVVLYGLKLQSFMMRALGVKPSAYNFGYWLVCIVWYLVFTICVFATAVQVEKWVDVPSVRFAKWLEGRFLRVYKNYQ